MRGYKIVNQGQQWQYLLIPNNNNKQPVAKSSIYASEKECKEGLSAFRELVIKNHINSINSSCITLDEQYGRFAICYMIDNQCVLKTRYYENKQTCQKSINAIFTYIDEYTL